MGLAIASELARSGRRVLLLDRAGRARAATAEGTSMRAYGNVLVLGHPRGLRTRWALRARQLWRELLARERAWHREGGILLLARAPEEVSLLEEFQAEQADPEVETSLLTAAQVERLAPSVASRPPALGLYSPRDMLLDPRALIPAWRSSLADARGVTFHPDCPALAVERNAVRTPRGVFEAGHVYVCTGFDVAELFEPMDLTAVKLQMLVCDAVPQHRWEPVVAGGLTMAHMAGFAPCRGLEALRRRLGEAHPDCVRYGIHVMGAVSRDGSVLIGDSHEYGADIELSDRDGVDRLMASYLEDLLGLGPLRPSRRWQAVYYRHRDRPWLVRPISPAATAVLALGGTGLTYSLPLAEHVVAHGPADPLA
jgi:FAD dependent oxidoreductase TIGR03364